MNKTINVTIDGQEILAKSGQTILEVATEAGIYIPTLCHHPALEPIGACRMCLVELSEHQPLHPACTYRVSPGMQVQTDSPRVQAARRFILDLIFSERNHYCMFCEMSGNCELQDLGYRYGLDHWVYPTYTEPFPVDATRDTFLMDHNRCVLCRRCVRACSELVANHTLGMRNRGAKTMISADLNLPFGSSSCVGCGTCLQVCPTGALIGKFNAYMEMGYNAVLDGVKTTCSQCSIGCGLEVIVREGNVVRIDGDWEASPNGGVICKMGRFDPLYDDRERITTPLIKKNGTQESVPWDEALAAVVEGLGQKAESGLGVLTSAQITNEALYLVDKLFRKDLGSNQAGLLAKTLTRMPVGHGTLSQIGEGDLILVAGVDPMNSHPVASFIIKRAMDKGARILVLDGPDNGLVPFAQLHIDLADVDQAVDIAQRAESPVVLYGAGLTGTAAQALQKLEGATFVALEPGANSFAARAYGLAQGFDGSGVGALYVLVGEEPWEEQDGLAQIADDAFLVVQASYESALTERAQVVLPMTTWTERAGTLTNLEGVVHQATQVVEPQGQAKADWEILSMLSTAMGKSGLAPLKDLSALAAQGLN